MCISPPFFCSSSDSFIHIFLSPHLLIHQVQGEKKHKKPTKKTKKTNQKKTKQKTMLYPQFHSQFHSHKRTQKRPRAEKCFFWIRISSLPSSARKRDFPENTKESRYLRFSLSNRRLKNMPDAGLYMCVCVCECRFLFYLLRVTLRRLVLFSVLLALFSRHTCREWEGWFGWWCSALC